MSRRLAPWGAVLSLIVGLTIAFAPSFADARAGGSTSSSGASSSSSMGSRGQRTFEQNGAAPITRSANPTPASPSASPMGAPAGAAAGAGGSFFQRHPFLTGLAGGFLGSMLFSSMGGFGHALGGLMTILLIGIGIWLVVMLVRSLWGRSTAPSGNMGGMGGPTPLPRSVGAAAAPAAEQHYRGHDTTVGEADLSAFQSVHAAVQEAWSRADLGALRRLMTPEMLGYFSEELTRNASGGVQNIVANVNLTKGEVTESWIEGDLQYATAYLGWSALDYVMRLGRQPSDPDYLASGDPRAPIQSEEMWTFVRRQGGSWLLSAIQQI